MSYEEEAEKYYLKTGLKVPNSLIKAISLIKASAALANKELNLLDKEIADAIVKVSLMISEGKFYDEVIVDVFQTGSGTGINMNINDIIARHASEILNKKVHPNDHVNMSQSSNDVIPSAIRIASYIEANDKVLPYLNNLIKKLEELSEKYKNIIKPGRTHLRDALPVTFGQELYAYYDEFYNDYNNLKYAMDQILYIPLGGTAVGTGINSHEKFKDIALKHLREFLNIDVKSSNSLMRTMRLLSDLLLLSSVYRKIAIDLWKIGNDLRLMFSGPNTAIGEIDMDISLAGSSIMPGKINPITVEAIMQASSEVIGLDNANSYISLLGEFELNMGNPSLIYNISLQSLLLKESLMKLSDVVLPSIKPLEDRMKQLALSSPSLITVFSPLIGYDNAKKLYERIRKGEKLEDVAKSLGLDQETINKITDLNILVKPGIPVLKVKKDDEKEYK
ncbi:fumarase [Caldisphaera lagunensis DSM 15908]|uniref:Fumarase n=1 Tax=Caldisphaera lagunensis (strain DSM 15908 / JCM 11604 / ANMR 0165 / IC-154) TaxID=1056495 RepID=L0AB34_CALLD|nr:lyase family protein [Caldisphaera lagunensis]AFZ70619.1 fumarase [Caldisphaera lagunensis DSM 15908]